MSVLDRWLHRRRDIPSFTCPYCFRTSYNKNDIESRYCGACHLFVDDPAPEGTSPARNRSGEGLPP
jgi:hypothetical protein